MNCPLCGHSVRNRLHREVCPKIANMTDDVLRAFVSECNPDLDTDTMSQGDLQGQACVDMMDYIKDQE